MHAARPNVSVSMRNDRGARVLAEQTPTLSSAMLVHGPSASSKTFAERPRPGVALADQGG